MSENNFYRNNQNLKKPGTKINWTKELISEYIKCKKDIVYFAENYFKIVVEKGLQLIKLRDYQIDMLKSMQENRFSLFCCSRQSGKCCTINTVVKIRNKKTGQIVETTVGELFKNAKEDSLR